jgi:hypothetical protein
LGGILALFFISATSASVPLGPYVWAVAGIVAYWLVALPAARRHQLSNAADRKVVAAGRMDAVLRSS